VTTPEDQRFELHKLWLEHSFQAKKQELDRALEREKLERQQGFEARKEYSRQVLEYVLSHQRNLKEYGQMCLRSLFLMNGAAVIGLLSFMGTASGKPIGTVIVTPSMFVPAFWKFGLGLVATLFSMLFAYYNYIYHDAIQAGPGELANNMVKPTDKWPGNYTKSNTRRVSWTQALAVLFGIIALVLFLWGCEQAARSFGRLR
jgi:hypothetical protein